METGSRSSGAGATWGRPRRAIIWRRFSPSTSEPAFLPVVEPAGHLDPEQIDRRRDPASQRFTLPAQPQSDGQIGASQRERDEEEAAFVEPDPARRAGSGAGAAVTRIRW